MRRHRERSRPTIRWLLEQLRVKVAALEFEEPTRKELQRKITEAADEAERAFALAPPPPPRMESFWCGPDPSLRPAKTKRQQIVDAMEKIGRPATLSELANATGLTAKNVCSLVQDSDRFRRFRRGVWGLDEWNEWDFN